MMSPFLTLSSSEMSFTIVTVPDAMPGDAPRPSSMTSLLTSSVVGRTPFFKVVTGLA